MQITEIAEFANSRNTDVVAQSSDASEDCSCV